MNDLYDVRAANNNKWPTDRPANFCIYSQVRPKIVHYPAKCTLDNRTKNTKTVDGTVRGNLNQVQLSLAQIEKKTQKLTYDCQQQQKIKNIHSRVNINVHLYALSNGAHTSNIYKGWPRRFASKFKCE
jgi:hypothetical protein